VKSVVDFGEWTPKVCRKRREVAVWFKKEVEEEKKKRRSTRRGSGRRISEGPRLPRGEHHKTQLFSMDIAWIIVMG